jgi:E3 ubiquitin-protein ligase DRIP
MLINRADHSWQDLRAKIFLSNRKKAKEPETVSLVPEDVPSVPETAPAVPESMPVQEADHSVPLIGRRKERSLSSLVVSTPKKSVKSFLTGKRSKPIARKRESPVLIKELVKKVDDYYESLSSPETLSKIAQTKRQVEVVKLQVFLLKLFSPFCFGSFENDVPFL